MVAVSGGPDSTALLLVLSRLAGPLGITLEAAHFDHMIRSPGEAADDRAFVQSLCGALGVRLSTGEADVPARARRRKESLEEAARKMRYRFLDRVAKEASATAVAVGHTLDDRAETVLMHIIRGSGLDGLAAMPPRAPWPLGRGPELARPLIELRRSDTVRYCREAGIEPREDPTNELLIATRNRLRHQLMPLMRSFNPRIEESLARLAELARGDSDYLESEAASTLRTYGGRDRGGVVIDRKYLQMRKRAVASRIVRQAAAHASPGSELDWQHTESVLSALSKRNARICLPGGLVAMISAETVTVWPGEPPKPPPIPHVVLDLKGETIAGDWRFETHLGDWDDGSILPRRRDHVVLDMAATGLPLKVRSRQDGDRLRPLGLRGTKKVQDILVDAKVPRAERDRVPIVEDGRGIVWVVGQCIADRVKVTAKTRHVIRLSVRRARRDR